MPTKTHKEYYDKYKSKYLALLETRKKERLSQSGGKMNSGTQLSRNEKAALNELYFGSFTNM